MSSAAAIWHDIECGSYVADLALWEDLVGQSPGPVLDVGAGTGRVAVFLARAGHDVDALELDSELMPVLRERGARAGFGVIRGDACAFAAQRTYGSVIVPMQTIHLLADRGAFLACASRALAPGGLLGIAVLGDGVEQFEGELEADAMTVDGRRYSSTPTAVRLDGAAVILERRREASDATGTRTSRDVTRLRALAADQLEREALDAGLLLERRLELGPTGEHAGSHVVVLRRPQ